MEASAKSRPIGVAVVAIVAFVQGVIGIIGGIAVLVERNDESLIAHVGRSSGQLTGYGTASIVLGAITLLIAFALWRGAEWALLFVGFIQVIHIAGGVYLLIWHDGAHVWDGAVEIAIALIVLFLLFGGGRRDYFEDRPL